MPRRFGLPSVYAAAALATAVTTAAPVVASVVAPADAPAPASAEPPHPYIVTATGRAEARALVGDARWRVRRYYTAALPGFATLLTSTEAAELRADPRVRALEPDGRVRGLDLSGGAAPSRSSATGEGVTVYVLGTGVDVARDEFGDRAWHAFDATGVRGRFCGDHGTRAASLAAGGKDGVAPGARVGSVKVLRCDGSGDLSDVLAGLDWVHRHARRPAVANLPVAAGDSPALTTAVRRLGKSDVAVTTSPRTAGTMAGHLESHPPAGPSDEATWPKSTAARDVIRQNPSRTLSLLLHGDEL
ncbi:S8 family serine peptidase [Nonomuraea sp. bgisy101]|uniref:S8 family serine peptidase n=1 Tax=Nonomuraea sp. bgisy101 TaxID=3413784 RepID=UPI003D73A278